MGFSNILEAPYDFLFLLHRDDCILRMRLLVDRTSAADIWSYSLGSVLCGFRSFWRPHCAIGSLGRLRIQTPSSREESISRLSGGLASVGKRIAYRWQELIMMIFGVYLLDFLLGCLLILLGFGNYLVFLVDASLLAECMIGLSVCLSILFFGTQE
jgi:hypothetical protein